MAQDSSVEHGVEGIIEDVKGKAKEVAGEVTGHEDLEHEGRAQQDKAGPSATSLNTKPRRMPLVPRPRPGKPSSGSSRNASRTSGAPEPHRGRRRVRPPVASLLAEKSANLPSPQSARTGEFTGLSLFLPTGSRSVPLTAWPT